MDLSKMKSWQDVPLKEGQTDNNNTRIQRWQEANGMKLNQLTGEEQMEVLSTILPLPEWEIREWIDWSAAKRFS